MSVKPGFTISQETLDEVGYFSQKAEVEGMIQGNLTQERQVAVDAAADCLLALREIKKRGDQYQLANHVKADEAIFKFFKDIGLSEIVDALVDIDVYDSY